MKKIGHRLARALATRRCLVIGDGSRERMVVREIQKENRIAQYVRETRAELRKVVWPSRQEAFNLTTVVVVTVLVMSAFLGVVDFVFTQIVRALLAR